MADRVKLAVLGAGLIGKRHIERIVDEDAAELMAIVDPAPEAKVLAARKNARWYPDFAAMLADGKPDGIIIATPNRMHVAHGLDAVAAGIPALVEKPIADDVDEATTLVEAAEKSGVPLLVGHHRRHNPTLQRARKAIDDGRLGHIVAVHGMCWFYKPESYFDVAWRRQKGAGPILINLIHDVDLLRYLCGEVVLVQALESNALRGHEVEETAVVLLKFASGVLGTLSVSDKIVAPWSWELTSGENPAYTHTREACYMIGGTRGSLAIPRLDVWRNPAEPSWLEPILSEKLPCEIRDPLAMQVRNLCDVIRGTAAPVVPAREGLETLRVIASIKVAAATGQPVPVKRP